MPNFPPGSPNNVNVTPAASLVFTPTPGVQASVRFWNPGSGTTYVGGPGVTPGNGLPILPGNRPVELQNVNVSLYACSGITSVGAATTVSGAVAAGATTFTVASAVTVGAWLRIGNGTGVEYVQVSAGTGTVTTSSALLYDHAASATVATVTASPGPLSVQAGVV